MFSRWVFEILLTGDSVSRIISFIDGYAVSDMPKNPKIAVGAPPRDVW
jgi:hypothetical protein